MKHPHVSRRDFIKTGALALPFLAAGCASFATGKRADEFVSVRNGQFQRRGRPYFYVGTNLWYGCYVSDAALPGGSPEIDILASGAITAVPVGAGTAPPAGRNVSSMRAMYSAGVAKPR